MATKLKNLNIKFLSTPSARRATFRRPERGCSCAISIHALREEGVLFEVGVVFGDFISIHALREEGDWFCSSGAL